MTTHSSKVTRSPGCSLDGGIPDLLPQVVSGAEATRAAGRGRGRRRGRTRRREGGGMESQSMEREKDPTHTLHSTVNSGKSVYVKDKRMF